MLFPTDIDDQTLLPRNDLKQHLQKKAVRLIELQSGAFSYNLMNVVTERASQTSSVSNKQEIYNELKRLWLNNLQKYTSIPLPAQQNSFRNNVLDKRLTIPLPSLKRIPGLEGIPAQVCMKKRTNISMVKEFYLVNDNENNNGDNDNAVEMEINPPQSTRKKRKRQEQQADSSESINLNLPIISSSSDSRKVVMSRRQDVLLGMLVEIDPKLFQSSSYVNLLPSSYASLLAQIFTSPQSGHNNDDVNRSHYLQGRVTQIYRSARSSRTTITRKLPTSLKIRLLSHGGEVILPWPNAYIVLGGQKNVPFPPSNSNNAAAVTASAAINNSDNNSAWLQSLLDDSDSEEDDNDNDNDDPVHLSLLDDLLLDDLLLDDQHHNQSHNNDNDNDNYYNENLYLHSDNNPKTVDSLLSSNKPVVSLLDNMKDNTANNIGEEYVLLASGERVSKATYEDLEAYYADLPKRKVKFVLKQQITSSSSSSSSAVETAAESVVLHPDDDPCPNDANNTTTTTITTPGIIFLSKLRKITKLGSKWTITFEDVYIKDVQHARELILPIAKLQLNVAALFGGTGDNGYDENYNVKQCRRKRNQEEDAL